MALPPFIDFTTLTPRLPSWRPGAPLEAFTLGGADMPLDAPDVTGAMPDVPAAPMPEDDGGGGHNVLKTVLMALAGGLGGFAVGRAGALPAAGFLQGLTDGYQQAESARETRSNAAAARAAAVAEARQKDADRKAKRRQEALGLIKEARMDLEGVTEPQELQTRAQYWREALSPYADVAPESAGTMLATSGSGGRKYLTVLERQLKGARAQAEQYGVDISTPEKFDAHFTLDGVGGSRIKPSVALSMISGATLVGGAQTAAPDGDGRFSRDAFGNRLRGEVIAEQRRRGRALTPDEVNAIDDKLKLRYGQQPKGSGTGHSDPYAERLAAKILKNPTMYSELTSGDKGRVAVFLPDDFAGFGRRLDNAALEQIASYKSSILQVRDLATTLKQYEEYIGPAAGWWSELNPYSDGRKARAAIDLVRQRVGKTLEGGVLRKEDEEKYKKILSTMFDDPRLALFKAGQLAELMEQDLGTYIETQKAGGRNVSGFTAPGSSARTSTRALPKVGDVRTLRNGQRVKITAIDPVTGKWSGKPVE